ncbi:DUF192 domain-containing protein [Ampullimonas aquatilis]|uniref:DUF192 domain-containing protein n=1 Tax=Ampullimonas aquatilis TaxID=1341549 RepID=UPI003C710392
MLKKIICTVLTGFTLSLAAQAQTVMPTELPTKQLNVGIHLIQAEVAQTYAQRAKGLMFRETMGSNQGMVFVFDKKEASCMWMKNTLIPLSVAFLDDDGTILNIEDMQPQTETNHCARAPMRYALEMNLGWFKNKGIKSGSKIAGLPAYQ